MNKSMNEDASVTSASTYFLKIGRYPTQTRASYSLSSFTLLVYLFMFMLCHGSATY